MAVLVGSMCTPWLRARTTADRMGLFLRKCSRGDPLGILVLKVWEQFQAFKARSDTFSLGVCNGCQLMALLGWIPKVRGRHLPIGCNDASALVLS